MPTSDLCCWRCGEPLTGETALYPMNSQGVRVAEGNDPSCEACETASAEEAEEDTFRDHWEGGESRDERYRRTGEWD